MIKVDSGCLKIEKYSIYFAKTPSTHGGSSNKPLLNMKISIFSFLPKNGIFMHEISLVQVHEKPASLNLAT